MEKLETVLKAIGFGRRVIVTVQDGKIVSFPEQEIESAEKIEGLTKITKLRKPIEISEKADDKKERDS